MKHLPVYNKLNYLNNPMEKFELAEDSPVFSYKENIFSHKDITNFVEELKKGVGSQAKTIVNGLSHKVPFMMGQIAFGCMEGVRTVFSGKFDSAGLCVEQVADVLVISDDRV